MTFLRIFVRLKIVFSLKPKNGWNSKHPRISGMRGLMRGLRIRRRRGGGGGWMDTGEGAQREEKVLQHT